MFKIVASPRAWWPVVFAGVTEEGAIIENRFQMRFALLDEDGIVPSIGRAVGRLKLRVDHDA